MRVVAHKDPGNGERWYHCTNGNAVVTQDEVCIEARWRVEDRSYLLSH